MATAVQVGSYSSLLTTFQPASANPGLFFALPFLLVSYQSYILSYAKIRNYRLNPYFLLEEIKKSFSSFIRRGLQAYYLHAPMVQSCNGYPFPYAAVPRLRPRGRG